MTLVSWAKKGLHPFGINKSKSLLLPRTSLAFAESLTIPLVQEVVISADVQCMECQKRVADILSRMDVMESVEVNVLEKKMTLTCKNSNVVKQQPTGQVATIYRDPPRKLAVMLQKFVSSCS